MAIIDDRTAGRNYALPNAANKLKDDVVRLRAALASADGDVTALLVALDAKAALVHAHVIGDVTGLQPALDGKQPVGTFGTLDDLTDVSVTGAANGQVLIKQGASWIPIALQVGNVTGLETLLDGKAGATATTDALALKAPLASPALTGTPTAPTATPGTDTTQVATTAFTAAGLALKAPLASPALTGAPTAPTPTVGDSTTKIATTAFVAANAAIKMDARPNLIVNGSMIDSQERGNTLGTTNGYFAADQFGLYFTAATAAMSIQRVQSSKSLAGAANKLEYKCTTAKASLGASDFVMISQPVEGSRPDFVAAGWGAAGARQFVYRHEMSLPAGLYHLHVQNSAGNRHITVPFTVAGGDANVAKVREIVVPGDTAGTWLTAEGTIGAVFDVVLAAGATLSNAAGATWGGTAYYAASTQFNILSSTANVARLADVGLKLDPDATGVYGAYEVGETDAVYRAERYLPVVYSNSTADAIVGIGAATVSGSPATVFITIAFPVETAKPVNGVSVSSASHFEVYSADLAGNSSGTAVIFGSATTKHARINVQASISTAPGDATLIQFNNAAGKIIFTGARLS